MYCLNCMSRISKGSVVCPFCGKSVSEHNAPHQLESGTILNGKYLVGRAIGEGGFGITYIGLDLNLELKIAVKEFFPNGFANRSSTAANCVTIINSAQGGYFNDSKKMFLREAKSLAKFSSEQGIVDVRDYFTANNTAYIVMEYIEGGTLSSRLNRDGVFRYDQIFRLMLPIIRALSKMHAEGIIHRDISPDNIMFDTDGSLKLMDFGAARYYTGREKKTMSVMLKPGYTPYEQYSTDGNQGPWTDVYALCATIYKCITGKAPENSLNRVLEDNLKVPSEIGVVIPDQYQNILMYGLAIYPDNRCQSMTELRSLFENVLSGQEVTFSQPLKSKIEDSVVRTSKNDVKYKTMLERQISQDNDASYSELLPVEDPFADEPQKNSKALVAVIVSVASVLVIGTIVAIAVVLSSGNIPDAGLFNLVASTAPADTTVQATTEKATEPTTEAVILVPNVVGMKSTDAYIAISAAGLKHKTEFEYSDSVPEDYVISQSPKEDTKSEEGDTVTFTVSRGEKKKEESSKQEESSDNSSSSSSSTIYIYSSDTSDRYNLRTSSRYISRSDISWMNIDEIQFAINEIYAKNGFNFTKEPYKSYFGAMSWYHPDTKTMDTVVARMNVYEKENIKVMGAYRDSINK